MIKKLKSLVKNHGAAQVCVWLGIQDTRTLNTWISRETIPFHMVKKVEETIKKKGN